MLTVGSLFAGIGGFDLGLERAGMRSVWQCELDPYCVRVLEKHWPDVLRVRDVRDVGAGTVPYVDVIAGGFPCQDVSQANPAAVGIEGARSGLWSEMLRCVHELRPRYVVVENVPALLGRGVDRVLGDLAACGYDAEWDCIPASAVGAPHRRDRIWLVAYPGARGLGDSDRASADAQPASCASRSAASERGLADTASTGWAVARSERPAEAPRAGALRLAGGSGRWEAEPDVGRVAHGVPHGMDRLRALGNAVVPQVVEWIGRRIIDHEEGLNVF